MLKTLLSILMVLSQTSPVPNYQVPIHGKGSHVETPDGRLYYEKEGSGPAVFVVAGGPGSSHILKREKSHPMEQTARQTTEREPYDRLRAVLKSQYHASLAMLRQALEKCPASPALCRFRKTLCLAKILRASITESHLCGIRRGSEYSPCFT